MYLTCKNGSVDERNRWYQKCRQRAVPFVVVSQRRKYAKLEWDCISLPLNLDSRIRDDGDQIIEEILRIFGCCANGASKYLIQAFVGNLDNLYPQDAEDAAKRVFEILNSRLPNDAMRGRNR